MPTHLAAIIPSKGSPLTLQPRQTPKPGPNDLLISIKSIALNPADAIMHDTGLFITTYPTVLGFDMSGLVLETGTEVPSTFKVNTRVAAYAALVWKDSDPDYGPFQEKCLVPWQHAAILPESEGLDWNCAATLPVSVQVPLSAWDAMGIHRVGHARDLGSASSSTSAAAEKKKEALLIWGASSSVGSMGVQTARLLRDDPTSTFAAVYATAGPVNQSYISSLGADRVFDYKDPDVVEGIISAARGDGLVIRHCFLATGELKLCQGVLKAFLELEDNVGHGSCSTAPANIASAPPVPTDADVLDGMETIFVMPSAVEEERLEQFRYWIGTFLQEHLDKGTIRPSPEPCVVGKGLEALNAGLDRMRQGVSCKKLIVEIAE